MHVAVSKIPCWHGVPSGAKESWGCSGLTEQGCLPDSHRDIRAAAVSEQCCQHPAVLQKRLAALVVLFQMDNKMPLSAAGTLQSGSGCILAPGKLFSCMVFAESDEVVCG